MDTMPSDKIVIDPCAHAATEIYKLLIGSVVPRPIAFVSTISAEGIPNLAPFSFFNVICANPPVVSFASGFRTPEKDTLANVRANGEFVVNIVTEEIAEQMNLCSGDYQAGVDEFKVSGLTPAPSDLIRPPRVAESPMNMECKVLQILDISTRPMGGSLIIGEVVRFHMRRAMMHDFRIDPDELRAIGRMGGSEYTRTRDRFEMLRPRVQSV